MITGWFLCFLFGVVTGALGQRARLPLWSYLPLTGAMGFMISHLCFNWGLP